MSKKIKGIPVNRMADEGDVGIVVERLHIGAADEAILNASDEARQAHREDRHSFYFLEEGTVALEIDFENYEVHAPSIVYMHPDQVHRILRLQNVTISAWALDNESLNPEYRRLLEYLVPAKPSALEQEFTSLLSDAVSLCVRFLGRKSDKLYKAGLKDACNALVALVVSHYLAAGKAPEKRTRFRIVADAFKTALEKNFIHSKSPAEYAQKLHVSTSYLNECVKQATGYSVSHHIRQRIVLEAKRLLHHSHKSVKEISSELGYDDTPYFSRLFVKAVGMAPAMFRDKSRE